ncbi:hypothetical protein FGO68_gene2977 [Halteria grandinella]|uniref:Nuclear nucleic acid-binding protein C1D n=1 Tax=Halteria grandinella TaxID=5974 RepID=A0A8J8NRX5_HALGN|nr:hypothetical protein FGO68_gene2977 [Halteria grandinella]
MEASKKPLSLDETLSQIDDCLTDFHTRFSTFTTKYPNFEILGNSSAYPKEQNARTNLGLAYALNSLYYSTLRLAQTDHPTEVKQHPVHAQIKIVRDHYVKLDNAVKRRKVASDGDSGVAVVHRIVERTVKENARIIKGQEKEAEIAKKKAQTSSSESESSDSEESSESSEAEEKSEEKPVVEQIGKKKSQVAMHGATVVPVPAYLRNKQLLERLKK